MVNPINLDVIRSLQCLGIDLDCARRQVLQPVFSGTAERTFVHRNAHSLPMVEFLVANQNGEYRAEGRVIGYSGNIDNGNCHLFLAEGNLDSHYCPDFFLCDTNQIRTIPINDIVSYSHL